MNDIYRIEMCVDMEIFDFNYEMSGEMEKKLEKEINKFIITIMITTTFRINIQSRKNQLFLHSSKCLHCSGPFDVSSAFESCTARARGSNVVTITRSIESFLLFSKFKFQNHTHNVLHIDALALDLRWVSFS